MEPSKQLDPKYSSDSLSYSASEGQMPLPGDPLLAITPFQKKFPRMANIAGPDVEYSPNSIQSDELMEMDIDNAASLDLNNIGSESISPIPDVLGGSSSGLHVASMDALDKLLVAVGPATLRAAANSTPQNQYEILQPKPTLVGETGASSVRPSPAKNIPNLRLPSASKLMYAIPSSSLATSAHAESSGGASASPATLNTLATSSSEEPELESKSMDTMEKILHAVGPASIQAASISTPRSEDGCKDQGAAALRKSVFDCKHQDSIDRSSPRLLNSLDPERRAYIIRVLRKSIPLVAKARRELIKKNAEYSRLCILDAFQGRLSNGLANNSKKSWWIYTIFCIQTSEWMLNAVICASVLHTLSIFFEPSEACLNSLLFKLSQWFVVLVYAVDIALKMSYEGPQEYFRHDWQQLYVVNLAMHVVDLTLCGCSYYANPLRPVAGVLRARKGRKFFDVLKKMLPGMMHSLVPIIFFVLIIMAMCSISFDQFVDEFRSTAYTSYNWLFLIFTNDNFERLLPDPMIVNLSYLLFFFPAIYVGQRFLLSLIIGDTYETFRSYVKKQLKKEKLKEMQGLTKAFSSLDDRKCGIISNIIFRECLVALHPDMSEEAVALYFELMAGGSQSGVNVLQFLSLRQVLAFKMNVSNSNDYIRNAIRSARNTFFEYYRHLVVPINEKYSVLAEKALAFIAGHDILDYINLFDIAIFSLDLSDHQIMHPIYLPCTLCNILSAIYVCEFLLRLVANRGHVDQVSLRNNSVALMFLTGSVGVIVYQLLQLVAPALNDAVLWVPYFAGIPVTKFLVSFRLLRCVRMANLNEDLKDFTAAIMDILPALVETFLFTFIVTYIFGALGNLFFGAHMEEWSTPLRAVVKAQELTFMVSYLGSMEEAMKATHPAAVFYFVFYLVLSLTVSNIALSIIIDLHGNVLDANSKKNREKQSKKLDMVFNKIVGQARVRQMFSSTKSLNFKNVTISEFQTSDVRHFITDANEKDTNLDDLKQCQKYASVDLVKFYNEQHQNHKDINWEVEFLKTVQDLNLHIEKKYETGEVLFREGDVADQVFILMQGTVIVSRLAKYSPRDSFSVRGSDDKMIEQGLSNCMDSTLFHPTNLLGAETLQPGGRYSLTVTAEHDTKCLVFKQSDLVHKVDADVSGSILRMAFKSHAAIETSISENRKRRRFTPKVVNTC